MPIKLGPVLNFRGCSNDVWKVGVMIAVDDGAPPVLEFDVGGSASNPAPVALGEFKTGPNEIRLYRYDCDVKQTAQGSSARYAFGGAQWTFAVPAKDAAPVMAYASCNGFSSLKLMKNTKVPNAQWAALNKKHQTSPLHLLLLGGDQIYFDSMWEELDTLSDWAALPTDEAQKRAPTESMKRQVAAYYRTLYLKRWTQKDPAQAFATIPTLMMWDDHDIFDGWGSYPEKLQQCKVYAEIFGNAREAFRLYQQQCAPGALHPLALPGQNHFTFGCRIGPVAILAPDMRSERTLTQVLSSASWKATYDWLDALPDANASGGVKHLFLMSSIPVVHPDFGTLESALGIFPGYQELEDDLRDHWTSVPHRQERLRLIHRLLDFSAKKCARVTLLSGDVHVGAVGVVRSQRATGADAGMRVINQLTSSGIVHPAPPGMVLFFLEHVIGKVISDDRDLTSEIIELPGTKHHFIGARNWLALEPDQDLRYWANWHVENEKYPFTKVIHPVGYEMKEARMPG